MASVVSNGARIEYAEAGAGEPAFVFVHGWGCDRRAWQPQFEDLSRSFRCVALDLRGRGESESVPPFDLGTHTEDMAAVIREAAPTGALVCGHSQGGNIALLLNARYPELVRGIVLADAPIGPEPMRDWEATREAIRQAPAADVASAFEQAFVTEETPPDAREAIREMMRGQGAEEAVGWLTQVPEFEGDGPARLVKLADAKPFMALWAQRPMGDVAWMRMTTVFVRHELVAGTGHFLQLERPTVTSALLRAFVDDVERDPRVTAG